LAKGRNLKIFEFTEELITFAGEDPVVSLTYLHFQLEIHHSPKALIEYFEHLLLIQKVFGSLIVDYYFHYFVFVLDVTSKTKVMTIYFADMSNKLKKAVHRTMRS
jgi:hypothetical protein